MSNEIIATFDDVSYLYPRSQKPVLKHISFEVKQGEFLGLIGPTGAGKSTLCLAFNGIVPQFYGGRFFGEAKIAGLDTVDHSIRELSRHIGAVFEDPETQLVTTSVENEIAFALENQKLPADEIWQRIPEALEAVRLDGTEKRHPQELSGGQKQRLSIAAALAMRPVILILDEPTSQLDPVGAEEVFAIVRELNQDMGVTILMASHAAEEMATFADRILLLSDGEIFKTGTPDEIYGDIDTLHKHYLRPPQVAETLFGIQKHASINLKIPTQLEEGMEALSKVCQNLKPKSISFPHDSTPQESKPLISISHLEHTYPNGTLALQDISLDINKGEYVLIIGQNGAGKTTLVRHFLKLLEPTHGKVLVDGKSTSELEMSELARSIGYIAQNPDNQIFTANVEEEVTFALKNLGYDEDLITERTLDSLENMGLLEYKDLHPLSLPKGDRARIVIAAILAMEPDTIIFDEPTTGQDYRGAKYILDVSRKLHQQGKTVIVITHHLYLMPDYAQRVVVMGKGSILLDAPTRTAFHEVDILQSTYLNPPQSVELARHLGKITGGDYPLMTPKEIADTFEPLAEEVNR